MKKIINLFFYVVTILILTLDYCAFVSQTASGDTPRAEVAEQQGMPEPGGEKALRLEVIMPRKIWGDWEHIKFDYRIVNATNQSIKFKDGDSGRGFAGKVIYLRDSRGNVRSFGYHWADPKRYPANLAGRPTVIEAGGVAYEQNGLQPADSFGSLEAGTYTLQVLVPSGRLAVNDNPTSQLTSQAVEFNVVTLTPAMRQTIDETPKDSAGVTFEPLTHILKPSDVTNDITLRIVNGSSAIIKYRQYFGSDSAPTGFDFFAGDGHWHKYPGGWCKFGLGVSKLNPGQNATIRTDVPLDVGRFVRFTIQVSDEGNDKWRTIVSQVVEIVNKDEPSSTTLTIPR